MRRADRLFDRPAPSPSPYRHDGEGDRARLEISERTVYRDIRDLVLAGTPIDGEAGVGYRIRPG